LEGPTSPSTDAETPRIAAGDDRPLSGGQSALLERPSLVASSGLRTPIRGLAITCVEIMVVVIEPRASHSTNKLGSSIMPADP
jgi:hypothetical protein